MDLHIITFIISICSLTIAITNLIMNILIKKKTEEPIPELQKVQTIVQENNEITKLLRRETMLDIKVDSV